MERGWFLLAPLFTVTLTGPGSSSVNTASPFPPEESFLVPFDEVTVELTNGSYRHEIAGARTFGARQDEQAMRNMGLIRGASSDNCIVLTDDGIENPPLRYADEFVRHKVLDLIGDLALIGKQILGAVVADRAGHAMHTALVSRILRDRSYWEETVVEEEKEVVVPAFAASARVSV